MSHTPGPWRVAQDGSIGSIETVSGNKPVGHSFQTQPTRRPEDHDERIANARLMAAAPELLEALKSVIECWDSETLLTDAVVVSARDAILKAEGLS